jgi:hypothetical protein
MPKQAPIPPEEIDEFYRLDLEFSQPDFKRRRKRHEELAAKFRGAYADAPADQSFLAEGKISRLLIGEKGERNELDQAKAFRLMRPKVSNIFQYFKTSIEAARDVLGKEQCEALCSRERADYRRLEVVAKAGAAQQAA